MSIFVTGVAGYIGSHMVYALADASERVASNSRALIETAIKNGARQSIFSSTCTVHGNPAQLPVTEDTLPAPIDDGNHATDAGRWIGCMMSYSMADDTWSTACAR